MNNQIKKINFNHSFIFFLICNIFSLIIFKFYNSLISPLICLFLILSIGISHGSLDHIKGEKRYISTTSTRIDIPAHQQYSASGFKARKYNVCRSNPKNY